ncbi:hypothetical protein WGM54_28310, partial [Paenibacillus polymyxa]|uniref:hypothetical protein n=1 Tax=Paenibacillus polymyxa TaxID=1406 RepID=UPI00307E07F4
MSDQLAAPTPGFRPRQNVFDAFATTLLEQQLQHLSDIKPDSYKTPSALSRYVDSLVNPDALFSRIRALGNTVAGKSAYQQPAWMHHAPVADRQVIAKQLAALAMFEQTSKVKALPSLERYTT